MQVAVEHLINPALIDLQLFAFPQVMLHDLNLLAELP
jgi:hypothetical protein